MTAPNVIIVLTDDQGYGDLGCTGSPWQKTPNIDKFASSAVRCHDFHVSPLCTPTRGALLTGRYPTRNGAWATAWGRSILRETEVTLPELFKSTGYQTGLFGKWHLGDSYPYRPQDRGFDTVVAHKGGGVGQTPDFWGNNYFDDTYFHNGQPKAHEGYCTDIWFDEAMSFVDSCDGRPFFALIATNAPHAPYNVDSQYAEPYQDNDDIPEPSFCGMITNIDENFGKLENFLVSKGLDTNTLLLFMTDNGSSAGAELDQDGFVRRGYNAGMRGMKGDYYDGGHRVPLFIRCPMLGLSDRDVKPLLAHVDLLPILASLVGFKDRLPEQIDGVDASELLLGRVSEIEDRSIHLQCSQSFDPPTVWNSVVLRGSWRLIRGEELYDVQADPEQRIDVSGDYPDIVAALRQAHIEYWNSVEADLARACPHVIGHPEENPVRLDAMDLHGDIAWDQTHVIEGVRVTGSWPIRVDRPGQYRFRLTRWPEELNARISSIPIPGKDQRGIDRHRENCVGKMLKPALAQLAIGDSHFESVVNDSDRNVQFVLDLSVMESHLTASFVMESGEIFGAYYVYCERIS